MKSQTKTRFITSSTPTPDLFAFPVLTEQGLTYEPAKEFKVLDVAKAKDLLLGLTLYPLYVEEVAGKAIAA